MSNMIQSTEPIFYTTADIQRIFRCGKRQAYELMHAAGFPSIQVNRKLLVERTTLNKWIEANKGRHVITM